MMLVLLRSEKAEYSSELANKVISMITETEVKENASTRCGIIEQIQEDNNGSTTVILGF